MVNVKILVVSDSHGARQTLLNLKERYEHEVDAMVHCGDSELQSDDPALQNFIYVKGNCDIDAHFSSESVRDIGGYRFFITHGHLYNVRMTLQNLSYKAEEVGANIVLFGHTHHVGSELGVDQVLYVNPGSILLPRGRVEKTYAILHLKEKEVIVNIYDYEGNYMKDLSASYIMS
mgnify:CR=1 FL=1